MTVTCPVCEKHITMSQASVEAGGWKGRCPHCRANLNLSFDGPPE